MNKLVCLAGMPGAGKSLVSDFFVQKGYHYLRFGQITIDEIKKRKLKINEENEKKIREEIRKKYGMAAYAVLNYPKFKKLLKKGNVIGDGLYSWSEYKFLKEKFKNRFYLVAVYAPPTLRYQRLMARNTSNEDENLRFRKLSTKEAVMRDYAEIENLEKGGPIAMADFTLINTKSILYLKKQIKNVYEEIEKIK